LDLPVSRFLASGKIVWQWRNNFVSINSQSAGFSAGVFYFQAGEAADTISQRPLNPFSLHGFWLFCTNGI
jgi:hypothetical protein